METEETATEGGLLRAADFDALTLFDGLHVSRSLVQTAAGAGIEPGKAAAEAMDVKLAEAKIGDVDIGDFQFAAGGRAKVFGDIDDLPVINIQTRDGVIAAGRLGFLLDGDGASFLAKLDDAVAFRVVDAVAENRGARAKVGEGAFEAVRAVKNVVAENKGDWVQTDKRIGNQESLGDTGGARLFAIVDGDPPTLAIAQ